MNKPFKPTKRKREKVMLLAGAGQTLEQIASVLGVCGETIRRHFTAELANGRALKQAENLDRLEAAAAKGNVTAMKFLAGILAGEPLTGGYVSKKKQAEEAAKIAGGENSEWGDDLRPPKNLEVN